MVYDSTSILKLRSHERNLLFENKLTAALDPFTQNEHVIFQHTFILDNRVSYKIFWDRHKINTTKKWLFVFSLIYDTFTAINFSSYKITIFFFFTKYIQSNKFFRKPIEPFSKNIMTLLNFFFFFFSKMKNFLSFFFKFKYLLYTNRIKALCNKTLTNKPRQSSRTINQVED